MPQLAEKSNWQSRHACFTIYPKESDLDDPQSFLDRVIQLAPIRYMAFQLERCPTTDRPHFQGYVEFSKSTRRRAFQRLVGYKCHCKPRKGTQREAIDYCFKVATRISGPYEAGIKSVGQGARSDLKSAVDLLKESCGDVTVMAKTHPTVFVKYHRGLEKLAFIYSSGKLRDVEVFIHWGLSNCGKTYSAWESSEDPYFWTQPQNGSCYALGYRGQSTIVIDDFYSWLPYSFLLRLLDKYPMAINTLGGVCEWRATKIYLTSNQDPRKWYPGISDKTSMFRRIKKIIHFIMPWSEAVSGPEYETICE